MCMHNVQQEQRREGGCLGCGTVDGDKAGEGGGEGGVGRSARLRDENGVWTSDCVLCQVTVKQHDEDGERVCASKVSVGVDFRLYQEMEPDMLIRVTLRNLSRTRDISVMPVYVNKKGDEEPEGGSC